MIELPESPLPNGVNPTLLDFGIELRPSTGAALQRIDRLGSRFRLEVSYPPMPMDQARVFVARLLRAKSEGLRMPYPLLGQGQGAPGNPVVDGADQTGTSLAVRGLTPGYRFREGFWISIENADGRHYLHSVQSATSADATGDATLTIYPMLRDIFADGDTVHVGKPMVEGVVTGAEWSWTLPVDGLVSLSFPLEEVA